MCFIQALNHEVVGEEQTESAKRAFSCKYASCSNLKDAFELDLYVFVSSARWLQMIFKKRR